MVLAGDIADDVFKMFIYLLDFYVTHLTNIVTVGRVQYNKN